jgi:hypothetical protein
MEPGPAGSGWAKLFTNKMPLTAVQTLNSEVPPTFEDHEVRIDAVLSADGREFCGRADQHPYELFLQLEGIEHKTTCVGRSQSAGIVERLDPMILHSFKDTVVTTLLTVTTSPIYKIASSAIPSMLAG